MILKESETLELKKSTAELKEAVISIAAILNKHGKGRVYFGVKNDGTPVGQQIGDATLREVSRTISEHIEPKVYPTVKFHVMDDKPCILVEFDGEDSPYFAYGRAYMRVADEDRQLAPGAIERLMARKRRYRSGWEGEASDAPVAAVGTQVVRRFVRRANDAGRMSYRYDNARDVLHKLGLLRGRSLLNAGRVLFCPDNSAEVQAAVFAGTDKLTFLDIRSFRGNLFDLIEKSETYLKEHIDWRADLSGSRRKEIPEVPVRALREAIINSLCHRDFSNPKGNEVAVFKDRIEIYNPGRFPEDYSPGDFIKGGERSILRNPMIAHAFYLTSDIERWGSGLRRIHEACREAGVKVEFRNLKSGFVVIFRRKPPAALYHSAVDKTVGKTVVKTSERIVALLKASPALTVPELAKLTKLSRRGVEWNLRQLRMQGRLKRVGGRKTGSWEISG
ncbi:MAG TPA: ATP-binding protein [Planctomycetota bacterium]|nr:ATP-binding protein [Planctomycetota bacterium]